MTNRHTVPPLVADSLAALEARDYKRAQIAIEEALADHPDDRELESVLGAIDLKIECLRVLEICEAKSDNRQNSA